MVCTSPSPAFSGGGDPSPNCSSQRLFHFFLNEFSLEFFLVFLEGLGQLRGSSIEVCEAICDMACKKGYANTFDLMKSRLYMRDLSIVMEKAQPAVETTECTRNLSLKMFLLFSGKP